VPLRPPCELAITPISASTGASNAVLVQDALFAYAAGLLPGLGGSGEQMQGS
jgi:hypothetical protein